MTTVETPKQCTAEEARALTNQIVQTLTFAYHLVKEAWETRAWAALGYDTWQDYCQTEFGTDRIRIPADERAEVIGAFRAVGMSTRAIAAATGMSHTSVRRATGTNVPVGTVTGVNGKTYSAKRQATANRRASSDAPAGDSSTDREMFRYLDPDGTAHVGPTSAHGAAVLIDVLTRVTGMCLIRTVVRYGEDRGVPYEQGRTMIELGGGLWQEGCSAGNPRPDDMRLARSYISGLTGLWSPGDLDDYVMAGEWHDDVPADIKELVSQMQWAASANVAAWVADDSDAE